MMYAIDIKYGPMSRLDNGAYVPSKPMDDSSLIARARDAWAVFTTRAVAVRFDARPQEQAHPGNTVGGSHGRR